MTPAIDIRAERLNRGLSQRAAARQMGIESSVLIRAESGVGTPHPRNALKIADFFGYRVTDIWPIPDPKEIPA